MKLSPGDRKFLRSIHVTANPVFVDDTKFLADCGISTALTPEEFQDANTHRDFSNCRGCGAHTFEQHAQNCPHRALDGTEHLDGTQQQLVECGLDPFNRTDYLNLAFAGHPPAELYGEIEEMLPDNLRDEINNAPSAGECGEPRHEATESDDDDCLPRDSRLNERSSSTDTDVFNACTCGSGCAQLRTQFEDFCGDCADADQMNYFLYERGLRETP